MQVGQRRERNRIRSAQIEHAPPELDGALALPEHVRVDLGHAGVAIGQGLVARRDVEHLFVDAVEIFPALGAEVQSFERLQRFRRTRFLFQYRQVARNRRIRIVNDVRKYPAEPQVQFDELAPVFADGDAPAKHVGELFEVALLVVDPIQESQGGDILGVETQYLPEDLLSPRQVAELGFENGGQTHEHVLAHFHVARLSSRLGHGRDVRLPLMGRAGEAQRLVEGLLGRGRLHDGARPPIEGGNLVHQLVLGDVGQTAQDALALLGIGLGNQLHLVDADELFPLLADAIERFENLGNLVLHGTARHQPFQVGARVLVLRRNRENFLIGFDSLGRSPSATSRICARR